MPHTVAVRRHPHNVVQARGPTQRQNHAVHLARHKKPLACHRVPCTGVGSAMCRKPVADLPIKVDAKGGPRTNRTPNGSGKQSGGPSRGRNLTGTGAHARLHTGARCAREPPLPEPNICHMGCTSSYPLAHFRHHTPYTYVHGVRPLHPLRAHIHMCYMLYPILLHLVLSVGSLSKCICQVCYGGIMPPSIIMPVPPPPPAPLLFFCMMMLPLMCPLHSPSHTSGRASGAGRT